MQQFYRHSVTLFTFFVIGILSATSQNLSDLGFSFQGYARNLEGAALSSTSINVQFSIYISGNPAEFTEEHTLTTDPFGVFQTVVGSVQTAAFKALNFSSKKYFMKVEVRPVAGTYATISDQALNSVPYAQAAQNGVPVGTILPFAGPSANIPDGFVVCDGSSVSSATYPALYTAIGTAWGDGSGGTNGGAGDFNVPDLRGMFLRGVSGSNATNDPDQASRTAMHPGGNSGNNVGSIQADELQSHDHAVNLTTSTNGNHAHNYTDPGVGDLKGLSYDGSGSTVEYLTGNSGTTTTNGNHTHSVTGNSNASGGNESRPINAYVSYIIRVE